MQIKFAYLSSSYFVKFSQIRPLGHGVHEYLDGQRSVVVHAGEYIATGSAKNLQRV